MDLMEAMKARHSVRQYDERPIEAEILTALQKEIDICNEESGLHIQLVTDEPKAFSGRMAHYGSFSGVRNYLALIGPKGRDLEEKCGYYGERLVLTAQQLGLNTCWVALTYSKVSGVFEAAPGEKLTVVIAVGYGKNQGRPRRSKSVEDVSNAGAETPEWFRKGVEAALLAPTAVNQQKFRFTYIDGKVTAKAGLGPCAKMDLGIVKYHFELGSGKKI
ncbi:MAG: nitroreductase [Oscillospiraceae bacterium]|nr:nitroreductase [Oscillospiraceae bacterium]